MGMLALRGGRRLSAQHAARGLRMQKADHARQSVARLLIDELDVPGARRFELACDVVSLEAYVMQTAAAPREEFTDRIVGVERFDQLDLTLSGLEQCGADALLFNRR